MSDTASPVNEAARARTSAAPTAAPAARNSRHVQNSGGTSPDSTTTSRSDGTPGNGPGPAPEPAARRSAATYDVPRNGPVTNSSRAPLPRSTSTASPPLKRVFSGTRTAPADTAPSAATIQSRELGAHTATRSPVATPLARHAAAARSIRAPNSA